MITTQEVITVPEKKKTVEEQKKEGKADTAQNEGKKEVKVKEESVEKGTKIKDGKVEKVEDISKVKTPPAINALAAITKGREIPETPGIDRKGDLPDHMRVITQGRQYKRWSQVPGGKGVYTQWEWPWPIKSVYKGVDTGITETFANEKQSRPSELEGGTWWEYFWNPTKGIPIYGAKNTTRPTALTFLRAISKDPQFGPHIPGPPMPKYFEGISTSGTGHYDNFDASGKSDWGKKFKDFIDFDPKSKRFKKFKGLIPNYKYHIWQESDGSYSAKWLTTEQSNQGLGTFPFFMQGRGLHEGYTPLGFNADWQRLVSTFRQSAESFGAGDIVGYGPPLPSNYKFSLIDIGLIMNFMQCGYVNRYKLPNKARPPLAASRTEQHLMMYDELVHKWIDGTVGIDPLAGNFYGSPTINLNWSHEAHWCGISTQFFNNKGNVDLGGAPTKVTSYEADILWNSDSRLTGTPLPLNRPRLEDGENDSWDESRWYALKGNPGYTVRNKWYEARDKFGAEKCQHPYDDDYINANKGRINQIWFIPGVHYQLTGGGKPTTLTTIGADLIKTAILKLDWGGAIITHSGHVETVLALDVDGAVYRYGGNTSVDGKGGNVGNAMGIWATSVGDFPDSEAGEERGGFSVITRSFPKYAENRSGLGISAPWKITPVVQTYFDFLVKNPNAEFGVFNDYGVIINKMNTIVNSSFLK
jgi:hypothetical protein